ncbi:TPA: hypothetical protein DD690_02730 [Candidatus Daviesbacteria bacterium]|uniref:TVP38/TMEM64 family membrane protein n=1 Tax=Candidatus Daviesbacteria bacterium GW2011_GWF2_38_6 TaxID=1618432 RepID=A0A0G0KDY7_9BACT|nr:MAG: hypothetical protein US99_C0050G0006 [Candidatus Daviesbacteria bacterium GW2011_GWF2_38_6]OGE25549.1 MAG: hypothetical protein A3D02_02590 [Candidatus Daviesbacteria bacterium RIFCSPHIGHO2_02_FULL_39_41]OGE44455.1 MAG: hypothetical protein A3E67_04430 [Candidatus Daviesbacteria bacterium RIFCSPHIGHO2_12_FULL_38_25]OGE68200.1 MAG: hypothetical protein A3H81_02750 [Candidatus Daviesbacteria bacterium RIFCSPLOWO2_02_FULL_38_18]OGE73269.1 MAG: hypothetical protein A3H18_05470 [Candidatus D
MDRKIKKLIFKTAIFIFSLSIAWYLIKSGLLHDLIITVLPLKFIAEFLAGMFYTSFLTSPISMAMIVVLAENNNPIILALLAGMGAVVGDLVIIKFFKEKLSKDVSLITRELQLKKINNFLIKWKLEFITPLIGAIIIASPLPDELGLMMLGASNLKYYQIIILTYLLNTAGILLIVTPINLLS